MLDDMQDKIEEKMLDLESLGMKAKTRTSFKYKSNVFSPLSP